MDLVAPRIFADAKKQKPHVHHAIKNKKQKVDCDSWDANLYDFYSISDPVAPWDSGLSKSIYANLSSKNSYCFGEAWKGINEVDMCCPYCDDATKDKILINATDSVMSNIKSVRSSIVTAPGMWLFVCLVEEIATGQGRCFNRDNICDFYACTTHIVGATVVPGITIYLDAVRGWDAMLLESPTTLYPGFKTDTLDRAYAKFIACIYWNLCKDLDAAEKEYNYNNCCSNQPHIFCGWIRRDGPNAFAKLMQKLHTDKLKGGSPVQLYGGRMKATYNSDYFLQECGMSTGPARDLFISPMAVMHYLLPVGGKASEYAVQLQLAMVGTDVSIMWSAVDISLAMLYLLSEEKMMLENDMFDRAFVSCRQGGSHRGQIVALSSHIRSIFRSSRYF
jgi:hypothetical protein